MNFDVKEKDGKLEVTVTLEKRQFAAQPRINLNILNVLIMVKERYPKYANKITKKIPEESTDYLYSDDDSKLKGVFMFALEKPEQKKKIKTTKTQNNHKSKK